MVNKKRLFIIIIFALFSTMAFSDDNEKKISIQASPLFFVSDIAYLFIDNDSKTYSFLIDAEFQYAINNYFNISVTNTLYFENYLNSYLQDGKGRYNEEYGQQSQYIIIPAFLYRPLGIWLKGMYISAFPIIGWIHCQLIIWMTHLPIWGLV
jgi:hypothetical protein